MRERTFHLIARSVQVVLPTVAVVVLLLAWLEIAGRPASPPPQVIVVPEAPRCGAPRCEAPSCEAPPEPAPATVASPPAPEPTPQPAALSPTLIVLETSHMTEWLGVVDIRRSEIDRIFASHEPLGSARILPHETDGQLDGFRFYGVRRNSALAAMGIRNGDIIHTINGRSMTTPDSALELYTSRPSYLDVRLTRRGRPARLLLLVHEAPNT